MNRLVELVSVCFDGHVEAVVLLVTGAASAAVEEVPRVKIAKKVEEAVLVATTTTTGARR
jgi:hypothetical protein